jgi:hypothetical protein
MPPLLPPPPPSSRARTTVTVDRRAANGRVGAVLRDPVAGFEVGEVAQHAVRCDGVHRHGRDLREGVALVPFDLEEVFLRHLRVRALRSYRGAAHDDPVPLPEGRHALAGADDLGDSFPATAHGAGVPSAAVKTALNG